MEEDDSGIKDIKKLLKYDRQKMSTDAGLLKNMINSNIRYSLTPLEYHKKIDNLNNLKNDIKHQVHKENSHSCLTCKEALTCRYLTRCELKKNH